MRRQQNLYLRAMADGTVVWTSPTSFDDVTALVAATLALWASESLEVAAKPKVRSGRAVCLGHCGSARR